MTTVAQVIPTAPGVAREHVTGSMVEQLRLAYNDLANIVSYMMPGVLLSAPATKTGTSAATAWRNEAFTFKARGLKVSKAAAETAFTATTHDVAANKQAWYVLSIQSGGTLTITKGADQTIGTDVLPAGPDNEVIVAYALIVCTTGTGFNASTDDFAVGTGIASLTIVDAPAISTLDVLE
jgi:azurin